MDSLPASPISVMVLAFLSGGTTLIGVSLAIALGENPRMIAMGIGFSTGIMVLISLCELVPEALRTAGPGTTSLSVGLGAALILTLHILSRTSIWDKTRQRRPGNYEPPTSLCSV